MATSLLFEEQLEIPLGLHSLADFRRWALSDEFPEQGRIDYVEGRIEVDMSPEDFFCHGTPKTELIGVIQPRIKRLDLGHLLSDRTRISSPFADLSVEPDIVLISHEALVKGRVTLVPKATGEAGRFVEVEGPPDLVIEILSDSSEAKDKRRLPKAYFAAGVREFWLVDARGKKLLFKIYRRGKIKFEPVKADSRGFQRSAVLGCRYRLKRQRDPSGFWSYDLLEK